MKISDLVSILPVRTVIRIADLGDSNLRRHMVESFVFTGEVSFALTSVLKKIAAYRGEGFFVIGNYGSGKSHLLNILSLATGDEEARQAFIASCLDTLGSESELPALVKETAAKNLLVVELSLVEHSSRENLEQIVLKAIAAKLQISGNHHTSIPQNISDLPRREAFGFLKKNITGLEYGGLLLLIDELSEFLRSKENPRSYNEDIRFLQYLGEFAEAIPAWIIATMQENIENTGALAGELLHKIKDRYPVRFRLTGRHVKEIVSGRLVKKKAKAETALQTIYEELQGAFKLLPFSQEDFNTLYPVHPVTVELLDELRPIFSQHRGVIDFIHFRLTGDPSRGIEPFIDRQAAELLTPDYIFDHFRDRLRETVETSPYSEQVFHHYEREVERIFEDAVDGRVALRVLKLLILGAVARAPRSFSVNELTVLLLYRYSGLESVVNYDYISEILKKLLAHGAYLSAQEKDGKTLYTIDLKADVNLLLEKKLHQLKNELLPGDRRMIEGLLPWADESYLPLKELQQEKKREIEITWHNTVRMGQIYFGSPTESGDKEPAVLEKVLTESEIDFVFFIVPPFTGNKNSDPASAWQPLPEECSSELRRSLALWVPRQISKAEEEILRSAYAYQLLAEEYSADDSPVGRQINRQLSLLLSEEKSKVKGLFRSIYLQGHLKAGNQRLTPSSFGYLPFIELTTRVAAEILKERYPRHAEIRPLSEQVSGSLMQRTLDLLFSPELEAEELERGIKLVIENFITPLGLVKKKGQSFQLQINPKTSPLTAEFLDCLPYDGRINLGDLYRTLRKGPFGLSKTSFQVLGMTVILSGAVSAYQGGKRLAPNQINYYRFWNIEEIGSGTLIRPELQKVLSEVPFLPARLRSGPLTFAAQQQTWEAVIAFKVEWTNRTADIRRQVEKLEDHPLLSAVNWDNIRKIADRFQVFLTEIKTSYASREGLERFLAACQSSPLFASDWQRLNAIDNFFSTDLSDILRIAGYLRSENLVIPAEESFEALNRRYRLLNDLLDEEALLWEEKYRERLKREFNQFRNDYSNLYLAAHNDNVGPGRIKPYKILTETAAYRLLEQLGRINALVVENDLVGVNRRLSRALEKECTSADEMRLLEQATCSCGYTLGEEITLPDREKLEKEVQQGVKAYLEALQAPDIRQKIEAYADHLELVGRRREAEPLRDLMKIEINLPPDRLIEKAAGPVNSSSINIINQALTGSAIIAERSIEDLQELLTDRVFNLNQVRELFQNWLIGEETKPPSYVRITRKSANASSKSTHSKEETEEGGLAAREFLEGKQPQLLAAAAKIDLEKIFALALLYGWFNHYELQDAGKNLLDGLSEVSASKANMAEELIPALENLGEILISDREELAPSFLEKAAEKALVYVPAAEIIELYLAEKGGIMHHFETLLNLFSDEFFFPALSRELASRLAVQISAEESVPQLSIIAGVLREAYKSIARRPVGLTASHCKEKLSALAVLQKIAESNLILHETEIIATSPPSSDKNWERFYRMLCPFELYLDKLEEGNAPNLIAEVITRRWRRRYLSVLEPLQESFARYLEKERPSRRQTLRNLLNKMPGWAGKEVGIKGFYFVIIDGARLDTWNVLLEQALKDYRYHILRDGLLWAERPTVTERQLQELKDEGLLGHMLNMNDSLLAEMVADPESFLAAVANNVNNQGRQQPLKAIKYAFVDEKIHSSRQNLPQMMDEILLIAKKQLYPLLEYISTDTVLLLAADHGFRTNHYYDRHNKEEPRYLHGSDTFFETLVPWTVLRKYGR